MDFSWNIRKYQDGDEQAIVELLNMAFGKWHGLEYWKWMYKKNPAGSPIVWLAEHDNKIISHFGLVPIRMKVGNTYMTACYGADGATHPDYQGKGVYTSVWARCNLDPAENGIPLRIIFPNRKLGMYKRERKGQICLFGSMTKVLNWKSLLRWHTHNKGFPVNTSAHAIVRTPNSKTEHVDFEIEKVSAFDERVNVFWEEISKYFQIIVRRDKRYLNWRYTEHPENEYSIYLALERQKILGYCVLREMQEGNLSIGRIADIIGFEDHLNVVGHLIQKALTCFKEHNLDIAQSSISEKHPYKPIFRKAGFIPYPRPKFALGCAINLPGTIIEGEAAYSEALLLSQNPFLKKKSNWFMMLGDFDWI